MSNQTSLAGVLASFCALMRSPTMRAQSEMRPSIMIDVGSVDDAFDVVGEGDVLGHEDVGGDSGGGGVGGERSGGVACGGDGEVLEAVVLRHGDGEAEAAGLEGAGGVGAFFLDVEAGVALAVEHGRPALAEGDGRDVGQDVGVAPHAEAGGSWRRPLRRCLRASRCA